MDQPIRKKPNDRIEGNKIILYDVYADGPKTLKNVEIITPEGDRKHYAIKKTRKGNYLFN